MPVIQRTAAWPVWMFLILASFAGCHPFTKPAVVNQDLSATDHFNDSLIRYASHLLRDGDLVLRTGNDFTSLSLRLFSSRDKTYSHSGLVHFAHGHIRVYHAIGGEDNPDQALRSDPFGYFCDPTHNLGFAVYRYDLDSAELRRLNNAEIRYYSEKVKFDMDFDLKSDNRLYCTEFVYKSLLQATGDRGYIPLTRLDKFVYVATDNLYLNPHARLVYKAQFR